MLILVPTRSRVSKWECSVAVEYVRVRGTGVFAAADFSNLPGPVSLSKKGDHILLRTPVELISSPLSSVRAMRTWVTQKLERASIR